jgi:hypothetical protein
MITLRGLNLVPRQASYPGSWARASAHFEQCCKVPMPLSRLGNIHQSAMYGVLQTEVGLLDAARSVCADAVPHTKRGLVLQLARAGGG